MKHSYYLPLVCSLIALIFSVVLGWLTVGGIADGTVPAFHLLEAYGFKDFRSLGPLCSCYRGIFWARAWSRSIPGATWRYARHNGKRFD